MVQERIIWNAEFNPKVATYWLLHVALVLTVTLFGIILLPIWFLVGTMVTRRYLATHRCTLTNRSLKFARGLLIKVEKTVPLDRITDLGLVQGPIMRLFDIEALSIETAGQSSQGAVVQLAGIKDGRRFRDAVLKQRDLVVGSEEDRQTPSTSELREAGTAGTTRDTELLENILNVLVRIEEKLTNTAR